MQMLPIYFSNYELASLVDHITGHYDFVATFIHDDAARDDGNK